MSAPAEQPDGRPPVPQHDPLHQDPPRGAFDPGPQRARETVSPDPDPATTTGLEPGGGVPPGETPPGESSTLGASDRQPPSGKAPSNAIPYVVMGAVVVLIVLFFVGRAVDLFG